MGSYSVVTPIFPRMSQSEIQFDSRRSVVTCQQGCVASSQPLASQIGVDILKAGGNAADAAVAVAAALNLTEPSSTGIGGDAFCLFYDSQTKTVQGLNGSGRAPARLTLELLNGQGFTDAITDTSHGHAVTVPGAAAAWCDTVDKFGSKQLSLSEILAPVIALAEKGFPVQKITANSWRKGSHLLTDARNTHGGELLIDGRAPRHGEIMKNPYLAQTFKALAEHGKAGFYEGRVAEAVVAAVDQFGGVMSLDDLKRHTSTFEEPISTDYHSYRVWEIPPNGQGISALMALNILEGFDLKSMGHNSSQYLHTVIEAMRLSMADAAWYCADPAKVDVPIQHMLSKDYAKERAQLISSDKAIPQVCKGEKLSGSDTVYFSVTDRYGNACSFINSNYMGAIPQVCKGEKLSGSDTVYFSVTDRHGNACSFINSNYMGFGTGIVPQNCGFTLQNRGLNFSLKPDHPNRVSPNKRPFHTIIPAMVTSVETGELLCSYGVMGGFMQPQGHVQVLLNMAEFGMDPQQALDQPRFCIGHGHTMGAGSLEHVALELGISTSVVKSLQDMGHNATPDIGGFGRSLFGRGQVIARGNWPFNPVTDSKDLVYWAGSDPRADGVAIGF